MSKLTPISVHDLGDYLREQRQSAQLSLRQLSAAAGISNPYLSQIERGLKRPSAEILQSLAKGLRISAESLYVRAGILEERHGPAMHEVEVRSAILADPQLTNRQRGILLDVYDAFVAGSGTAAEVNGRVSAASSTDADPDVTDADATDAEATNADADGTTTGAGGTTAGANSTDVGDDSTNVGADSIRAEDQRVTAEAERVTPNTRPVRRSRPTTLEPAAVNTTTQGE